MDCGTTHHEGCPCHEARRNAEVERLRDGIRDVADSMDLLTPDRTLPWEDQLRELLEETNDER